MDWTDEKTCFDTLLKELAFFYSPRPLYTPSSDKEEVEAEEVAMETSEEVSHQLWQLEHVLFPSFRRDTAWPRDLQRDVTQIANLPDLFRIFERC